MDAIVIQNLSKQFRKSTIRREYTTFKSELVRWVLRRKDALALTHLTALHDINLKIQKGQTFGLVGRNGSGKSTLLKLVTGIYKPTGGTIQVNGRISALLELGAGFHPEFSGRENILINGIILGMSRREIRARMDEIIEFSELGDFIDEPVRTYSSGMYARLAFAVATHVDPDILIIDEILSVGDEHFAHKSTAKMDEFRRLGKTILLVTHDLAALEHKCDVAAWLDGGTVRACGNPSEVVAQYRQAVAAAEAQGKPLSLPSPPTVPMVRQPTTPPAAEIGKRWGTFEMEITRIRVVDGAGTIPTTGFTAESAFAISVDYKGAESVDAPWLEIALQRDDGLTVWATTTKGAAGTPALMLGSAGTATLRLPRLGLADGTYRIDVAAYAKGPRVCDFHRGLHAFSVSASAASAGIVRPLHSWTAAPSPLTVTATTGS